MKVNCYLKLLNKKNNYLESNTAFMAALVNGLARIPLHQQNVLIK